jgi:hypothetical protein
MTPPQSEASSAPAPWARASRMPQYVVIFWGTLRQRGNNYLEYVQHGPSPFLRFE